MAERLAEGVAALRATGADVLLATGVDTRNTPLIRFTRGKVAVFNAHVWSIADRHGAGVLDLWGMEALQDRRMWAPDRIHLSSEGHRRVALLAAAALGLGGDDGHRVPLPPQASRPRWETLRDDAAWMRTYVAPWVRRRLRGQSSGDGRQLKRPTPSALAPRRSDGTDPDTAPAPRPGVAPATGPASVTERSDDERRARTEGT